MTSVPLDGAASLQQSPEATMLIHSLLHLHQARLSTDNTVRKDAEAQLNHLQEKSPDDFIAATILILRTNPSDEARQQAALHLKIILKEASYANLTSVLGGMKDSSAVGGEGGNDAKPPTPTEPFWSKLSAASRDTVKRGLLDAMDSSEPSATVRNAVCDATAILAGKLLADGDAWPELQPKIFSLLSQPADKQNEGKIVSALQVLSNLVVDLSALIAASIKSVRDILLRLLQSESLEVRVECVNFIAAIVESEKRQVWKNLQCCIPSIFQTLSVAMQNPSNSSIIEKILISLIDTAEYDSGFYSTNLQDVCTALFAMTRNAQLDERPRQLTLEFILTIVENKPKMCKKTSGLVDELLNVLMELLVTVEDDPDWINKGEEDENDEEDEDYDTSAYDIAESGLDRIAASIGGDVVIPKLFALIVKYLQQPPEAWQMRFAAMTAISQTVEHLPETEIEKYLNQIVPMCLSQLDDQHPRVRFSACQAIGQASTDTQPLIQEQYVNTILPALLRTLDDQAVRVQAHAARALTNFCEEVKPADISPYADALVQKLLLRVTIGTPKPLLSSCVTTLAVVASSASTYFVKYSPAVIPAMKDIVRHFMTQDDKSCLEKAFECITLVAMAIGAEAFAPDTNECMQAIIQLWTAAADAQQQQADGRAIGEGPSETLNECLCRMCRVLEENFAQYLPLIMPRLLKIIEQKPQETQFDSLPDLPQDLCVVGLESGKTIGLKTQVVLEMEQMMTMLYTFVGTLGENFHTYIADTVQKVLPLLKYKYCEKILQSALEILAATLKIARKFADAEANQNNRNAYMQLIADWMGQGIDCAIAIVDDEAMILENTPQMPKCAAEIIKAAGPSMLSAHQVFNLTKKVLELMNASCQRSQEIVKGRQDEHDEDDEDDIQGEERYELELAGNLVEILGAIIHHHSDLFCEAAASAAIEFIQAGFASAANSQSDPSVASLPLTLSLHLVCELIGMGQKAAQLYAQFIPTLIEALSSRLPEIQQPAAHAIKLIVRTTTVMPAESVITATKTLLAALERSDQSKPLDDYHQQAADNLVSAIGAMAFHQSAYLTASQDASISPSSLLNVWLCHLPLTGDDEEGQTVHEELVQLVLANNEQVVGRDMCNMPHLIKIFYRIYKTSSSTDAVDEHLRTIISQVGENVIQSMYVQLDRDDQKTLRQLVQDAQEARNAVGGSSSVDAQ